MATAKSLAQKAPLSKIDMTGKVLEVYKYPRNCQALVVAEFLGGHRHKGADIPRKLSLKEWKYVLWYSIFSTNRNTNGDGFKAAGDVISFSEKLSQCNFNFSGRGLFESLTKVGKLEGHCIKDDGYAYYHVHIPKEVWKEISQASVAPSTVTVGIGGGKTASWSA